MDFPKIFWSLLAFWFVCGCGAKPKLGEPVEQDTSWWCYETSMISGCMRTENECQGAWQAIVVPIQEHNLGPYGKPLAIAKECAPSQKPYCMTRTFKRPGETRFECYPTLETCLKGRMIGVGESEIRIRPFPDDYNTAHVSECVMSSR